MRLSNLAGDYAASGTIIDRQQHTAVGGETDYTLKFIDGAEEVYRDGIRQLAGASHEYVTDSDAGLITLNTPAIAGEKILLIGRDRVSGIPFQAGTSETVLLSDGQLEVTFASIGTEGLSVYVSGPGLDRGRLISPKDYSLKSNSDDTIVLTHSYPDGSTIEGIQGGRQAWVDPDNMMVNDGSNIKSISERFKDTMESDAFWTYNTGRQKQDLAINLNLIHWKLNDLGALIADPTGNYPVLEHLGNRWDILNPPKKSSTIISFNVVDDYLYVAASEEGTGKILNLVYGKYVLSNEQAIIRNRRLDSPLVSICKVNELANVLSGPISFERQSLATYIDMYGIVRYADKDTPRYEKDGWLIEGESTNICLHSHKFDEAGSWWGTRASISSDIGMSPDNTSGIYSIVEDTTASDYHLLSSDTYITTAAAEVCLSIFVKAGTRSWVLLQEGYSNSGVYFNLTDGTKGSDKGSINRSSIEVLADGWYRCSISVTIPATSVQLQLMLSTGDNGAVYTGDGLSNIYAWGAQLELNTFPTSYTPTTSTPITRAADLMSLNSLYNKTYDEYTVSVTAKINSNSEVAIGEDGRKTLYYASAFDSSYIDSYGTEIVTFGGGDANSKTSCTGINTVDNKVTITTTRDKSGMDTYINGIINSSDTTITDINPNIEGSIHIGRENNKRFLFGHISDIKVYDFKLNKQEAAYLAD